MSSPATDPEAGGRQPSETDRTAAEFTNAELERLGRQRPAIFASAWIEIGFVWSILSSMIMSEFFVSGFNIVLPELATALDIPPATRTWPAGVFSLVTGSMMLPMARLGDMYGGYIVFNAGVVWLFIWSLVAAFSPNYIMLIVCRALQGLGAAAFLPTGIMMLGRAYRPGPRKNFIFSMYGACAVLGFFVGIFVAGVAGQFLSWRWYFWIGTIILAFTSATSLISMPHDRHEHKGNGVKMDWWGVATIVPGLILVVFAFTDGGHAPQGWRTPYIIATFVLGIVILAGAVYVQGWVSADPLLPADLFKPKRMKLLVFTLFITYGVFGIFLFYASFYLEMVMHIPPLLTAAWFTPMAVGGFLIAALGGFTLHLLPGQVLLLIAGCGHIACTLLFALIPEDGGYWAYIFPAMVGATVGIDIIYNVTTIYITTSVPRHRQGQAGALIHSLLFVGISFFLGLADTAVANYRHLGLRGSYKVAFWLATGLAGLALVGFVFIPIGNAKSQKTVDEEVDEGVKGSVNSSEGPSLWTSPSVTVEHPRPSRATERLDAT